MSSEIRTRKATLEEWHVAITSYSRRDNYNMKCHHCQKETQNKKYCSRSCAAIVNNTIYPKRNLESQNQCKICGKKCFRKRTDRKTTGLCKECFNKDRAEQFGNKTKKEIVDKSKKFNPNNRYEKIRQHAKRICKANKWYLSKCQKCGYDKYVELCHINPISNFSDNTLICKINSKENICFLCPNCHWELDNLK